MPMGKIPLRSKKGGARHALPGLPPQKLLIPKLEFIYSHKEIATYKMLFTDSLLLAKNFLFHFSYFFLLICKLSDCLQSNKTCN